MSDRRIGGTKTVMFSVEKLTNIGEILSRLTCRVLG